MAALLLLAGYLAALLWGQLWLAAQLGAPPPPLPSPLLAALLEVNFVLLCWRTAMRISFTTQVYGFGEGLASVPRILAGNLIAILAAGRALFQHAGGGPKQWDKTAHVFPAELVRL